MKQYNPDSLEVILAKARAICTINIESLEFIQSRKDEQVITHRKYLLQPKHNESSICQKTSPNNNEFEFVWQDTKKDIIDIIKKWKWEDEPLMKETIVFDGYVDIQVKSFDHLQRAQQEYKRLVEKYCRLLKDGPESCKAAKILLKNMEQLQLNIGKIHEQTIDINAHEDDQVQSDLKLISEKMQKLAFRGISFEAFLFHTGCAEDENKHEIYPNFDNMSTLHIQHTLNAHSDHKVHCLHFYSHNDREYLASSSAKYFASDSDDYDIKLWDIDDYSNVGTLNGHGGLVNTMEFYDHSGSLMLSSGSEDNTIKIWNLSTNSLVKTLTNQRSEVRSLKRYKSEGKAYLISGCRAGTLKIWDIQSDYCLVDTLKCGVGRINCIEVFYRDEKPYVAVGGESGLSIWSLNDFEEEFRQNYNVSQMAVIHHSSNLTLACTDCGEDDQITLWNLESHSLIHSHSCDHGWPLSLQWIFSDGNMCLLISYSQRIELFDLEQKSIKSTIETKGYSLLSSVAATESYGTAILATGRGGEISIWSE